MLPLVHIELAARKLSHGRLADHILGFPVHSGLRSNESSADVPSLATLLA